MEYTETESYSYLIYLQVYLEGDIEKFKKLCDEAENEEMKSKKGKTDNEEDFPQTTMYPGSFEFIHGEPIIARSTIPHTLSLFSTIDILGYLTRHGSDYHNTLKNFNSFFCDSEMTANCMEINVLRNIYRHGLVHNYFPKLYTAIAYRSEYPTDKMFLKENNILVLNVKHLIEIVLKRLRNIIKDESLYPNMENQYNILIEDYKNNSSKDIDKLLAQLK